MDSIEITSQRTAAATAAAAKYLARDEPASVAIVGCGVQGRVQLRGIAAVRQIVQVHAYDTNADAARRFALDMAPVVGAPIRPADDLHRAVSTSDIVVTCTTSTRPILGPDDVRPGTFVAAVGADNPEKHEIDPRLLASSKVVADIIDQAATIGDLHHALAAGLMRPQDVHAELGEIVIGRRPGGVSRDDVLVFDSAGVALQDVAAAALVHRKAHERHVGSAIAISDAKYSRSSVYSRLPVLRHLR